MNNYGIKHDECFITMGLGYRQSVMVNSAISRYTHIFCPCLQSVPEFHFFDRYALLILRAHYNAFFNCSNDSCIVV